MHLFVKVYVRCVIHGEVDGIQSRYLLGKVIFESRTFYTKKLTFIGRFYKERKTAATAIEIRIFGLKYFPQSCACLVTSYKKYTQ
jgi:hypothetical protein